MLDGRVWLWPVEPTLLGYQTIFDYALIWRGYANTVFYTFFGTIINVVLTIMAAYPLLRRDLVGRNLLIFPITFTMIFSGGLIPTYLLVRELGMISTGMMIPDAIAAWNVIITRTYYQSTMSDEFLEAAQLDGCSDARFMWQIVVPLSGAITAVNTAVNTLFYAVGHWNAFFNAFIYLNDDRLFPLQIVLREILIANDIDLELTGDVIDDEARQGLRELLRFSPIVVASVPVLMMYPFVQKYFVRGVMIGSIKG